METESLKTKAGIWGRIIPVGPEHLDVAFIHQLDTARSGWSKAHDEGRAYLEERCCR